MRGRELNLNRISLDGVPLRRRAATLRVGPCPVPGIGPSAWSVSLACEPIPPQYDVGPARRRLRASTVSGQLLESDVLIASRSDDAYGTLLILAGLGPVPDGSQV